jgi:hypothetical protein
MKWSWSAYDSYGTCARRFYELKVARSVVEPTGEAALWGTRVHEALELAVRDGVPMPEEMPWEALVTKLRRAKGGQSCELKLAVNRALEPCAFDAEDYWLRGIIDFACVNDEKALALDYKTGRRKLTDQLKLMALLLFAHYPRLEVVYTGFVWLKEGCRIDQERYERKDAYALWKGFFPRLQMMKQSYDLNLWPAKPSGLCNGWCSVTSCSYNKDYRRGL